MEVIRLARFKKTNELRYGRRKIDLCYACPVRTLSLPPATKKGLNKVIQWEVKQIAEELFPKLDRVFYDVDPELMSNYRLDDRGRTYVDYSTTGLQFYRERRE